LLRQQNNRIFTKGYSSEASSRNLTLLRLLKDFGFWNRWREQARVALGELIGIALLFRVSLNCQPPNRHDYLVPI
jgi:hypothetical protein